MSTYTTGEIAKLCDVTVRTVQYYDSRGILIPSDFSEGGRRLYTDEDVQKLKIICFLREIGLQINSIADILAADNARKVIEVFLEEQERTVAQEISEKNLQYEKIVELKKTIEREENFTVNQIGDMAYVMENRKKIRRVRGWTLAIGIVMDAVEVGTFIYGVMTGMWIPFLVGLAAVLLGVIPLIRYYYGHVLYICPECHRRFRPKFSEFFWAAHTPRTRKLTCTDCGYKGFVVETYGEKEE